MKMLIWRLLILSLLIVSLPAAMAAPAKSGSSGGGGGGSHGPSWLFPSRTGAGGNVAMYFGAGAGTMTVHTPKDVYNVNTGLFVEGGVEVRALGPFWITLGVDMTYNGGTLNYDYTGTDSVHYTASDMRFYNTQTNGQIGLMLRLIDRSWFHLWTQGGAYAGSSDLAIDTYTNLHLLGQGYNYTSSQREIGITGEFAEAGIDLLPSEIGVRLAARVSRGRTEQIHVLADERLKFVDAYGYAAIIRQF
jgi:hypothetical protein